MIDALLLVCMPAGFAVLYTAWFALRPAIARKYGLPTWWYAWTGVYFLGWLLLSTAYLTGAHWLIVVGLLLAVAAERQSNRHLRIYLKCLLHAAPGEGAR